MMMMMIVILEVTKYTFKAFIVVFSFIMVLAGFYMNVEVHPSGTPLQFHETVYFLVITLATVGYGDIYPTTALGQITITLALTIGAGVLIPYHISKLMEKLQQDSPFLRNLSSSSITGHVILCGDITISHLLDFLSEFYHERYGKLKKELVILSPKAPDDRIKALLLHPFYKNRLIYLKGSPLFEHDLQRTKISKADSVFITLPSSWNSADTDNILCSYAVKSQYKNLKIFSHLISSKNKNKSPFLKGSIYVEEFRCAMLAQSIVCPGYNILFSNLFTSRTIPTMVSHKWLTEYYYGTNHSIYIIKVPEFLVGEQLTDVILSMYFGNGSLLIGIMEPQIVVSVCSQQGPSLTSSGTYIPTSQKPTTLPPKFHLNPPQTTILTIDMQLVLISHTVNLTSKHSSRAEKRQQQKQQEIQKRKKIQINSIGGEYDDENTDDTDFQSMNEVLNFNSNLTNNNLNNSLTNNNNNLNNNDDDYNNNNFIIKIYKKINQFFNKLAVPDLELLINEVEQQNNQETKDQAMNESLKTFIVSNKSKNKDNNGSGGNGSGGNGFSRGGSSMNFRNNSMTGFGSLSSPQSIDENLDQSIMEFNREHEEEELTSKELIKSLCLSEYNGDWIALLSDISSQKTSNPKTEEILERIRLVIDKHSLMTFTTHGKFGKGKKGSKNSMKGHMLIICKSLRGLDLFLHHLRLPYISSIKTNTMAKSGVQPIVVLYKDEPQDESWFSTVKTLPLIAFIKGSSSNNVDLDKCGAKNAETIIITSDPYYDQSNLSSAQENLVDSFTLMSYVDVIKVNRIAKITVELVHEPNIRFLEDKKIQACGSNKRFHTYLQANQEKTFLKPEFFSTPHYASGGVITFTVLDSLTCQAHNNHLIKDVAHELAFGVNGLSQSYSTFGLSSCVNQDSKCFSRLIGIPAMFHGRSYGEVLKYFLQQKNLLVLGLYRSKIPMSAPVDYIYTCPPPTCILHEGDQAYVLSNSPI
ncbi:calcium-activated BK potassium channel, alpha subunit family protein [Dictyostelium discoideum AX4]|uniref:Calcium-activated BK potassium channel, alpha subunit family protein n=1 Tax=Dictyostelium discoideum TaxID=44689 RepID=Q54SN1_DICDI|nr:calcium-activated BK potassium channel, alpha subunit family protein [Dictyostelium discoideum AX4]EAL66267.1 calcium-activated BK potassium channel, alpha subunit family protein [Dictyostelium discoideum AX4]|eukprot:XP_640270.1 calcium-activated BK potassium channel, alpha subunit family protein [Dictyostelium discoideum AX4]